VATGPTPFEVVRLALHQVEEDFIDDLVDGIPVPDNLFHYSTPPGLIGIVSSGALWATDLGFMNDSTEFIYGRSMILSQAPEMATKAQSEMGKRLLNAVDDIVYKPGGFYAACFCENGDLLSQWRGYAGGVGGYSIGFTAHNWTQTQSWGGFGLGIPASKRWRLRRVVYDADVHAGGWPHFPEVRGVHQYADDGYLREAERPPAEADAKEGPDVGERDRRRPRPRNRDRSVL
jgi:hypothetical protein